MKTKSNFWMSLFILAAGIALIATHSDGRLLSWIVIIIGIMFAVPGLIGLIAESVSASKHTEQSRSYAVINTMSYTLALVIGIVFIIWPQLLVGILVYVLAGILIVSGAWEITMLAMSRIPGYMPWWLYVLPVLAIGAGIILIATPLRNTEAAFTLVAGIALTCIGANGLFMSINNNSARRTIKHTDDNAKSELKS